MLKELTQFLKPPKPKVVQIENIKEEINRDMILDAIDITESELDDIIYRAKEWMLDNPQKAKASQYTLRTTRVLTFLKDHKRKNNGTKKHFI